MKTTHIQEEVMACWDQAMQANQACDLQKNIEQILNILTDSIRDQEYENLYDLFTNGAKRIEAWGNELDFESHADYYRVFSFASFWIAQKISEKLYAIQQKQRESEKKYEELRQLEHARYIPQMLELLETNGELAQGTIAKYLSLSSQALSNLLRRYEHYHFWEYHKYGKYNYYHLTNEGKAYLGTIQQKQIKECSTINHLLLDAIDCFAEQIWKDAPDIDFMIHKINKQLCSTQAVFGNEADKLAIRKSIRKVRMYNRRRERRLNSRNREEDSRFGSVLGLVYDIEERDYCFHDIEEDLEEGKEVLFNAFCGK